MATVKATWNPNGVALDIKATTGTVTRTSATQFSVPISVSWETYYSGAKTNYGMKATSGGKTVEFPAYTGSSKASGSGSLTNTVYSISGNGAQTKSISVTFTNYNTDKNDSNSKTLTITDISVPAWTSYTISYNANGGSGAPGSQTKWKDQALTLSSTKPTRTGHSFLGWSTSSTATSATYSAGGSLPASVNANTTLYAVWKADTYQVIFNANGGTGAPAAQTKTYGVALTLSGTKPTRTNYNFLGWGTSASATVVTYAAGGKYTSNAAITLYAIWELAYTKPRISEFSVTRCDSEGNVSDEGTCALVQFTWACDLDVSSVVIEYIASDNTATAVNVESSGTNGTVSKVIGNGELSIDSTYTIHVTVTDANGYYDRSLTLNGYVFAIDALYGGGKGIAFGKPAEKEGYADFAFDLLLDNNLGIYGKDLAGNIKDAFKPQNQNGNTVIGYGNYDTKSGNTNVYGYDINFGVSNIANPGTYRPYRRAGDAITISLRTSGYVTNSGKDISFWIPMAIPIIGSPTVTITSGNGFTLRQGESYTHGSSASTYVSPDSYEASATMYNGIYVKAVFSDTTNVTNNDAIGIYWNGTITFS